MTRFLYLACIAAALVVSTSISVADDQEKPDKKEKPRVIILGRPAIGLATTALSTRAYDTMSLVRNPKVKEEIKLTDEQSTQIDEAFAKLNAARREVTAVLRGVPAAERQKKFAEVQKKIQAQSAEANKNIVKVLKPEQLARLEQISVQQQGIRALNNPKIAKKLKLTDEQLKKIAVISNEGTQKRQQLIQDVRAGILDRGQIAEKTKQIQEQTEKEVMLVLTMEQQTRFQQMQGEKFDMGPRNVRGLPVPAAAAIRLRIEAKPLERKPIKVAPQEQNDE